MPAFGAPPTQWQDVGVPPTEPVFKPLVGRRRVLAGGAVLAIAGITGAGCGSHPAPASIDELEAQLSRARQDSELANAAAKGAPQRVRAALTEVASERSRHAQALAAEITRLAETPTSTASETTSPAPTSAAGPPPSMADVVNSLRASAGDAGRLATTASGYRAGLLGSIAAACTAAYSVALVVGESAS
jgi:hypothetical protein